MQDAELLNDYITTHSQAAFAELASRYVNWVYSAARRQIRDAHLAEDVTQAVFIILSQRAAAIRNPAVLPAWLLNTTRHVACNALRAEKRRLKHQRRAAEMIPTDIQPVELNPATADIEPLLDDALSHLAESDRNAIVLRFLQNKSVIEVAASLKISPDAAQKRLARALEKLRGIFARQGIATQADALSASLGGQIQYVAPAALLASLNQSTPSAAMLARATFKTIFWSQAKTALLASAATIVLAGGVTTAVLNSSPSSQVAAATSQPTTAPTTEPATPIAPVSGVMKFPNILLWNNGNAQQYQVGVDPDTKRTETSAPAGYIKSLTPKATVANRIFTAAADTFRGKRVRLSAWAKYQDIAQSGCLIMSLKDGNGKLINLLGSSDRPFSGTGDWKQFDIVVDVPPQTASLQFGVMLRGAGQLWTDDFQIAIVPPETPLTQGDWQRFSYMPSYYADAVDPKVQHDGHPTVCISASTAPPGSWTIYQHVDYSIDQYIGHKIRMTAWIKSEKLTGQSGLHILAVDETDSNILADEGQKGHRPIKGTTDWKQYTATCDVPQGTAMLSTGIVINGNGKMWLDTQSVKIELAD